MNEWMDGIRRGMIKNVLEEDAEDSDL
jgi:hypothetical protein